MMMNVEWTEKHKRHMCKLSTVCADMILNPEFDPTDWTDAHGAKQNYTNMFKILAETFIVLQAEAGLKPHFAPSPQKKESE